MLGLRRHTVEVVDHDPAWLAAGGSECQVLRRVGDSLILDAQHVGSTSVPGLPAKAVLDIALLVKSQESLPALIERLTAAGYLYRGDAGGGGGHLFVRESQPGVRVAHIHAITRGDPQWDRYVLFRDSLKGHAALRQGYAALKTALASRHKNDRRAYTTAKETFIREALAFASGSDIASYAPSDQKALIQFFWTAMSDMGFDFDLETKHQDLRCIPNVYQADNGLFLLAKHAGRIIGTIALRQLDPHTCELKRFYVLKAHQGNGLGTTLLRRLIAHAQAGLWGAVRLDTSSKSSAALSLFKRFGFVEIARYNDDPHAEIFMELKLH